MFRFTIRDMLWLTALVAVSAGWALEIRNRGPANTRLRNENQQWRARYLDLYYTWLSVAETPNRAELNP